MSYDSCSRILKAFILSLVLLAPSLALRAQENGSPGAGGPNLAIYPSLLQNPNVWKNQNSCRRTFLKDSANITPPGLNCGNFWLLAGGSDTMQCPSPGLADGDYISFHIQQGSGAPFGTPFKFASPCYGWGGQIQPVWCATPSCIDRVGCQSMVPPDATGASFICSSLNNIGPPSNWNPIAHATGSSLTNTVTTTAVNTTGANLLVLIGQCETATLAASSSPANTWVSAVGPVQVPAGSIPENVQMFKVFNPTTGAAQTATINCTSGSAAAAELLAFSGAVTGAVDQSNTGTSVTTSVQPGSITPTAPGELIITGFVNDQGASDTASIDSGFTISDQQTSFPGGTFFAGGAAYLTQVGPIIAVNPKWIFSNAHDQAAVVASFK